MDLERLTKELHGELGKENGFDEQDPYSDANKNSRK